MVPCPLWFILYKTHNILWIGISVGQFLCERVSQSGGCFPVCTYPRLVRFLLTFQPFARPPKKQKIKFKRFLNSESRNHLGKMCFTGLERACQSPRRKARPRVYPRALKIVSLILKAKPRNMSARCNFALKMNVQSKMLKSNYLKFVVRVFLFTS